MTTCEYINQWIRDEDDNKHLKSCVCCDCSHLEKCEKEHTWE